VLGLPTAAPWLKLTEAVGLLRAVAPRVAFPVHDAVLAAPGRRVWYGQLASLGPDATRFEALADDAALDLP
jgi:hypothetical protein